MQEEGKQKDERAPDGDKETTKTLKQWKRSLQSSPEFFFFEFLYVRYYRRRECIPDFGLTNYFV